MYAIDFVYDDEYLSDYHFIICSIDDNNGVKEISSGSEISFNQISINHGNKHSLLSTSYENCVTAEFDICKDPDYYDDAEITETEHRKIIRWLNRREFKKFNFRTDYRRRCYYNASFNIKNIYVNDKLIGFRLSMYTDRPYGFANDISISMTSSAIETNFMITNESDEIGYLYPVLNIKIKEDGDLTITNITYNNESPTIIKNCSVGEEIRIDCENKIITSTIDHINNDFNYRFLVLGSDYNSLDNEISISLPCVMTMTYTPIIKNIN